MSYAGIAFAGAAALAFFAGSGAARAADDVEVDTARRGDAVEIRASALLRGNAAAAWRVLTDYGRYAEFLPDMQASRIVSRTRNELVVEQRGDARFLWFRMPMRVTLAVTEVPGLSVESKMLAGTLKEFSGRYELQRAGDTLRLHYSGHIMLDDEHRGIFDSTAIRQNVRRQFRALVREIERVGNAAEARAGEASRGAAPEGAPGAEAGAAQGRAP